jgi:hypothetical protein
MSKSNKKYYLLRIIKKSIRYDRIKKLFTTNKIKVRVKSFLVAIIGFILSPLSWWNDLFVNIPLAYLFAIPFGWISKQYFLPSLIVGFGLLLSLVLFYCILG